MPKSKPRNVTKCNNCFLCEKVAEIHLHNDTSVLLDKVKQWDIDNKNQYKNVYKYIIFECFVCCFKTRIFNDWKCHIMSIPHLTDCHRIKDLYSYVCTSYECKVLLYGPEKSLFTHRKCKHSESGAVSAISTLMAEVMRRYINKLKPLHFCSHCSKFAESPIHTDVKISNINNRKPFINYYCKFCRVTFFSSPEMIDYHSLSVEHMTLKCFDELCSTAKLNSKRIKLSEQSNKNNNNKSVQTAPNVYNTNSVELPKTQNILDLTDLNYTIKKFKCHVCVFTTSLINEHKKHITSSEHRTKSHSNNYSYFCEICNIFIYGSMYNIRNHCSLEHKLKMFKELPILTTFMKGIYKHFKKNPNRVETIHYYGNNKLAEFSKTVSLQCHSCNIEFHTSLDDFNKHKITIEHIILKFLSSNNCVTYTNDLKRKTETTTSIEIPDVPSFKNHSYVKDGNHKDLQNIPVNKKQADVDCIENIMDNTNKPQKQFKNNASLEEKSDHAQNNSIKPNDCRNNTELAPNYSKPQYTKYFKHKMNILNLLNQFKERIMKNLSYYCDVCDFVVEEKDVWDKHNKIIHPDYTNKFTIYCPTCSMFIISENNENHDSTIEHCILLQLSQSLKPIEDDLMNKMALVKSVGNSTDTSDEMPVDLRISQQLGLNCIDFKEEHQNNSKIGDSKNNDFLIKKEQIDNMEDRDLTNSFLILNNSQGKSDETVTAIYKNDNGEEAAMSKSFSSLDKNQCQNEYSLIPKEDLTALVKPVRENSKLNEMSKDLEISQKFGLKHIYCNKEYQNNFDNNSSNYNDSSSNEKKNSISEDVATTDTSLATDNNQVQKNIHENKKTVATIPKIFNDSSIKETVNVESNLEVVKNCSELSLSLCSLTSVNIYENKEIGEFNEGKICDTHTSKY